MSKNPDRRAYEHLLELYTKTEIAQMLGVTKQAITRWKMVPLRYVKTLHEKTGIAKADLLPSVFD